MSRDRRVALTTSTPRPSVYVVHVHGALDHACAARAAHLADARTGLRLRGRCRTDLVVADLAAITSVRPGALPVLLRTHDACHRHGMAFALAGLSVDVPEYEQAVLARIPQVVLAETDIPTPRAPTP